MSDLINETILEQLFEKYLEQGYSEIEAEKLANKEFEEGYDYRPSFDEQKTKDAFSLISSENGELMYEERELLNSVYEFESDEFITSKPWNKKYFGGSDECQ